MSRKTKIHRTRIDADAYEVVAAIIAEHDDIKGTQAAVKHALLNYQQVEPLKTRLKKVEALREEEAAVLEETKGQLKAMTEDRDATRERHNNDVEGLKRIEALREEEAAALQGEREENETLKTRLHEAEERGKQARCAPALEKEAESKAVWCWLWGVCVGAVMGASLMFAATALWG